MKTWIALFLAGCGGGDEPAGPEPYHEGSDQTCNNEYDEDQDGLVDCADDDCADYCGGDSDADADADADTDADTDSDTGYECDVILQTGCDSGEACKLSWVENSPSVSCQPPGSGVLGQTCDTSVDCDSGMTCWQTCRPACHLPADCGAVPAGVFDASDCIIVQEGWGYCTTPCDPLNPGSCAGGGQCMLIIDGDLPTTDCVVDVGALVAGDDCSEPLQCSPGTACDDAAGGGFTCETVCDGDEDCTGTCRLTTGDLVGTCR